MYDDLIIITVTQEDGSEVQAAILDDFDFEGERYLALRYENSPAIEFFTFGKDGMKPLPEGTDRRAIYNEYAGRNGIENL